MEGLIELQYNTREKLENAFRNYKKDGASRRTEEYYKRKLKTLTDHWNAFKNRDEEVTVNKKKEALENHEYFTKEIYANTEEFFIEIYAKIESDFHTVFPEPSAKSYSKDDEQKSIHIIRQKEDFKLPQISLPTFSGDYLSWTTFYDLFKALVHQNNSLSKAQKLQYLKLHLSGEAQNLLNNTTISDANYEPAWNALVERYDNKRVLVKTQLDILLNQPNTMHDTPKGIKTLLDKTCECLAALNNLEITTTNWDPIIVYLVVQKLPYESHELWEQSLSLRRDIPMWSELREFLEARFRTLEALNKKRPSNKDGNQSREKSFRKPQAFHVTSNSSCCLCKCAHSIRQCPQYLKLKQQGRIDFIKSKGLCINCLGTGHLVSHCPSKSRCLHCQGHHHSTLHKYSPNENLKVNPTQQTTELDDKQFCPTYQQSQRQISHHSNNNQEQTPSSVNTSNQSQTFFVNKSPQPQQVLLATALVTVVSPLGHEQLCRALIDPGSQASFVKESVVQSLRLSRESIETKVTGLSNMSAGKISNRVTLCLKHTKGIIETKALILRKIANILPGNKIRYGNWTHINGLELADPSFNTPGHIDMLLGADIYSNIIVNGVRKGPKGTPVAQRTVFGWILSGETSQQILKPERFGTFYVNINPDDDLKKFWEVEEIPRRPILTEEEILCERHFSETHVRLSDGRYQVRLPIMQDDQAQLGSSRQAAIMRLHQLERHFEHDPHLKEEYVNCIKEYLTLGHMEQAHTTEATFMSEAEPGKIVYRCCYLPHHAVLKPSSTTTKLRVVFDASRRTSNGKSLNSILLNGPVLQDTLTSILMRWRKFKIAYTADVQKMYRQIRMHPDDTEYQRIVWRESTEQPIRDYKLLTVTFGTKSAPYLAVRTLHQLAKDESVICPIGAEAILNDFYVDDLMSGGDTVQEALTKQRQLTTILRNGGLELRKWATNDEKLLEDISEEHRETRLPLSVNSNEIKALGLLWNPKIDTLSFNICIELEENPLTKRRILSEIAKLFDPIGWLAPTIVTAKILIQTLWLLGLDWDERVPLEIENQWKKYRESLSSLQKIHIPRWVKSETSCTSVQMHGFCDASLKAYAAAVYLRVEDGDGNVHVNLLSAKTKVAPIKTLSLPKLELCGAWLLSKLTAQVQKNMQLDNIRVYSWTDSTIVLSWLRKHPSIWETFIANRVSQIHQLLNHNTWRHVNSEENPADCASRGIGINELENHPLWWTGPKWLKLPTHEWPRTKETRDTMFGLRKTVQTFHTVETENPWSLLNKYSSLSKLVRVTTYCRRWIHILKKNQNVSLPKYLTAMELQQSLLFWIKRVQSVEFSEELVSLKSKKNINKNSKLIRLNPFIDDDGIIRIGGRLEYAKLSFSERHPIILPEKNPLTRLIIDSVHKATMHGGTQIMLSIIRRKYWIVNARNLVRHHIHKCISCFRQKATGRHQLMANLPSYRIQPARPFAHTGVDYCGPFDLKASPIRNSRTYKGYLSIFICMVTKAMHIEVVSDLTTNGFLAAFRRFTARRGLCTDIYSDCGSNFIGANAILTRHKMAAVQHLENEIAEAIENQGIKWHFIPPSSPHFGGLWEAGVRSTKFHLKRIIGETILTYEELSTLTTQIEATLNSRPISAISQDPQDISALTPGHLLIGSPLITPPEPSFLDMKINRLERYQYIQQLHQHFWGRWNTEYLSRLQQRPKWLTSRPNVKINDLVLIKDERLPPSRWLLGRIIQLHPGRDKLIRVVTIKTQTNTIKRPITKICSLPIQDNNTIPNI